MYSLSVIRKNHKVYIRYYKSSKKILLSTGLNIPDRFWDSTNNKIKRSFPSFSEAQVIINQLYSKTERLILQRKALGEDIEVQTIKDILTSTTSKSVDLFSFINQVIEERKATNKLASASNLLKVKNKLIQYSDEARVNLDFKNIDIDFYYKFYKYFIDNSYSDNYFGSIIQNLKVILNDALSRNITKYDYFKHYNFKVIEYESDAIYLSEEELKSISELELPKTLDNCRKAFIIGCYSGLRYSDLKLIDNTSFSTGKLRYRQQKTSKLVSVPLHPIVCEYVETELPTVGDQSYFNKNIKEVCRIANLNSSIKLIKYVGGNRIEEVYPKWKLVKSHTMRRSFATNLHIRGIPSKVIMEYTGHTTLKSFEKYLKCTIKGDRTKNIDLWG